MTRFAIFAAVFFLACSDLATGAASAEDASMEKALKDVLTRFANEKVVSGGVVLVGDVEGTRALVAQGLREIEGEKPMRTDTVFRIASMTKPITAIAVMMLAEEGKLSVDDPVEKHLPEFKGQLLSVRTGAASERKPPSRPITLRDILTHTSGLADVPQGSPPLTTLEAAAKAYAARDLTFEPGSKWAYSNAGITTLGRIVEVVSGASFEDFLAERLFRPLKMNDTGFYPDPALMRRAAVTYDSKEGKLIPLTASKTAPKRGERLPSPAGGLYSTAPDLAKLYRMMLGGGTLDGRRYLKPESVALMTRTQTGSIKTGFTEGMSFGFGWGVVKSPTGVTETLSLGSFGHGGAWGTQAWIDPTRKRFVVLMIQRVGLPNSDASDVRREVQRIAFGQP